MVMIRICKEYRGEPATEASKQDSFEKMRQSFGIFGWEGCLVCITFLKLDVACKTGRGSAGI